MSGSVPEPPFSPGTVYAVPDIIRDDDPSAFQSLSAQNPPTGSRNMFDRRVGTDGEWTLVQAYLFDAVFDDGLTAEMQVNPEFGTAAAAEAEALKYAEVVGRLPTALRQDVQTVSIQGGTELFGGSNNNILIHVGQADVYANDKVLEEALAHEAAHTSLDAAHASAPGWLAAQAADAQFISTYARDNPTREDVAESFVPYLAIRYRPDRVPEDTANKILGTILNRIAYFDAQGLDMHPVPTPMRNVPTGPPG